MGNLLKILLVGILLLPGAALAQEAGAEAEPELEVTVDLVSRYVWRGYDLSHADPTLLVNLNYYPAAAPGLWMNVGAIAGLVENEELGDSGTNIDEFDLTIGYERELADGAWTLGAALYYYGYETTWTQDYAYEDNNDFEVNLYAYWQAAEHLRPTLEYYRGLDDGIEGDYVELGLVLPFGGERWSTEPKVTAGWSNQYEVPDRVTNVQAVLPLTWSAGSFALTPSLNYTWVDDPEGFNPEEITGETPEDGLFWVGVRLAWTF